jgi:hypothetical protein
MAGSELRRVRGVLRRARLLDLLDQLIGPLQGNLVADRAARFLNIK